jgi:PAS domain S-box-containing protein/putative nucleotidyltransferase with HDIG domain
MMEGFAFQADKALLDTVFDGVVVIELKHLRISLANKAAAGILGFDDPEELVGVDPLKHVSPEDRERMSTALAGLVSGSCLQAGAEIRVLDKRGKGVWIMARGVKLASNGNSVLLASFRDVTAQKTAEVALRESEKSQVDLLNSSNELILISQDWKIVFTNRCLQEALGLPESALLGKSVLDLTHPDDRKAVGRRYRQMLDGKYFPSNRAFKGIGKDGKTSWGMMRHVPFAWQGKPALMTIVHDITQQKLAEEALQESERRYRLVTENASDVIWTTNMDFNITYMSPSAARLLGCSMKEAMTLTMRDMLTPESLELGMEVFQEQMTLEAKEGIRAQREWSLELQLRRWDGSTVWVEEKVNFIRDAAGHPTGLIGITRDISERKKAESALRRIGKAVESSSDAIAMSDEEWHHFYHNKAFTDLFEYTAEELEAAGGPSAAYSDQGVAREVFNAIMSGGSWSGEVEMVSKSGRRFPVLLRADATKDESGRVVGLVGVHSDITQLKRAQEALTASELNYRRLFDHTLIGLEVVDAETMKVVLANRSIASMFGFGSTEEMVGTEPLDYVVPEDVDLAVGHLARALADSTFREVVTLRVRTEDGRIIWVTGMATPFEYVCRPSVLLSLEDVTAAKQAELNVAESEEKNRLVVDNAAEGIIVVQDGALKFANPKCTEISGYSNEELLSRSFLELVHPDDRQVIAENYAKRLSGEEAPNNYRFRIVDRAGGIKWLQINTVQFSWEGKPSVLSMLNDVTERRQAEEAFRESESRYRLLAENVSDVIWSVNMRTKRVLFSPSVTRLLGYTLEEAQSMKAREVVSPTSFPKAMMYFSNLLGRKGNGSNGRSSSTQVEVELMRKDGSFVWVDISVTLLRDAEGQPAEIFGVMRDVTQRKKVEEDLRTSEEYFRALIENAWDAIAIVNAEGTMLYESPSSARILGYEPEEIVGKNLAEFVRPEDVAAIADTYRRFRTEPGSIVMVDAGFRHKDGHYIECEGTLQNFLHDPKINGVVANYRDVTDRRRAEEAIRNSEERFRNLVEATSDWVWEVDPNGVYTYASPNVREVMGYEVGEVIGKSVFDHMPARESSRFSKIFRSHVAKREAFAFVESPRIHKDGRVIILETSGVPFFGDGGRLLGYRGIGRDITSRKKTEKDLEDSLKKVEKTMEAAIQAISYTMETRDPYTTGHQRRVTQLACAIAKEMGIAPWQIDGIRVAGLLHDIGKIAVPTEILSKPGRLSDIEFSMIKAHPKVGFDILKNVDFEWPIARIVVQHHERLDGSGYPFGLHGKDILQESRILAVADVVEAMSSHRPYRPALGTDKALAEVVRGEGTLYDSEVVRACAKVIKERGFKFQG